FCRLRQIERPWADERHFATQDVPELWQLIEAPFAQPATEACQSWILIRVRRCAIWVCLRPHRTKLVEYEWGAVLAGARLPENGGATALAADAQRDDTYDWSERE